MRQVSQDMIVWGLGSTYMIRVTGPFFRFPSLGYHLSPITVHEVDLGFNISPGSLVPLFGYALLWVFFLFLNSLSFQQLNKAILERLCRRNVLWWCYEKCWKRTRFEVRLETVLTFSSISLWQSLQLMRLFQICHFPR